MKLIFFGAGYCSRFIIPLLGKRYDIICTHNKLIKRQEFDGKLNIKRMLFEDFFKYEIKSLRSSDIIINSIPPISNSDILVKKIKKIFDKEKTCLKWFGYLSSTSVYGDHFGNWVTEKTELLPKTKRGIARLKAENQNLKLYKDFNLPVHIFRLPGIYGPDRSIVDKIKRNRFVIKKNNHYFSRIYVDDIASAINKSINKPTPGEIFNLTDDLPERNDIVADYAASLMNINLEKIKINDKRVNEKAKDFYKENKKVSNKKIKKILSWTPKFKNYKIGINEILK